MYVCGVGVCVYREQKRSGQECVESVHVRMRAKTKEGSVEADML